MDRLVKDIVAESAASYVSILHSPQEVKHEGDGLTVDHQQHALDEAPTAFSLERFLPLLEERVNVLSPFTRIFLVAWISLLDSIPDLELVTHLPRFLRGLFRFLSDPNQDVKTATHKTLERFLNEIRSIAGVKRTVAESRKSQGEDGFKHSSSSGRSRLDDSDVDSISHSQLDTLDDRDGGSVVTGSSAGEDEKSVSGEDDWVPGQDVQVDHAKILDILVSFLGEPRDDEKETQKEIQLTALRWIDSFFEICPEDIMPFVPRLLTHVLPMMSHDIDQVRVAANKVNTSLMDYIMSLSDDSHRPDPGAGPIQLPNSLSALGRELTGTERRDSNLSSRLLKTVIQGQATDARATDKGTRTPTPAEDRTPTPHPIPELDYQGAVNALTLQFLNEHEATRVAAIAWLIMLHKMAPGKVIFDLLPSIMHVTNQTPRYSQLKMERSPPYSRHCRILQNTS